MEWKKLPENCKIEIEKYPDGSMGVILSKTFVEKFDRIFKDKPVNVFVALAERDRKMIIEIRLPKHDYIA